MAFNASTGGSGDKKKFFIIGGVAVIIVILILLLRSCGSTPASETGDGSNVLTPGEGTVSAEELEHMTPEEIQEALNQQAEAGYITISANMYPQFESGTAEGNLLIANTAPGYELTMDCESVAKAEGDEGLTFTYDGSTYTLTPDTMDALDTEDSVTVSSEDGASSIIFSADGTYTCGEASGEYVYDETAGNHYSQIVEIYIQNLDGSLGEKVYTSPVIPVGSYVHYDTLDVDLDAGTYSCVACFYNVSEDNAILGQANAQLELTVLG